MSLSTNQELAVIALQEAVKSYPKEQIPESAILLNKAKRYYAFLRDPARL